MIVSNPLESDVEVSKVDWVVPPSIDTQLIDGVALLDDQGDDKAKENQSKGDGDISKTIFLGLDPTPDNRNLCYLLRREGVGVGMSQADIPLEG